MGKPVYKTFKVSWTEAAYALSEEEREALLAKLGEALDAVGCKRVVLCDSTWASDRWSAFGVEEFPDIEALQKHAQLLNEIDWYRYIEADTLIGTVWED